MKSVSFQPDPSDSDTLDLGSIPGVKDHYQQTSDIPILVFREARAIRIIHCPFPGTWKLEGPTGSRSLIPGSNTFPMPLNLTASDELTITPLMSAVAPSGPRVQVPAILSDDIGELEVLEDLEAIPEVSGEGEDEADALVDAVFGWDDSNIPGGAA